MPALRWGSATDTGRLRSANQDGRIANDKVFAVADGMGGHRGGEVASQMALTVLEANFHDPTADALVDAARQANAAVYDRSADDPDLRGMGTTLVAIAPVEEDDALAWINVGDSRLYRLHDGELEQLSRDDSLVEEWVREGTLSAEEAREHPQRNILTRALGIDFDVIFDSGTVLPYTGDRYLLCSDGLFNEVDEARIASTLRKLDDPGEAARELVRLANENGGRDNITTVVVDVIDDGDRAGKASVIVTAADAANPSPYSDGGVAAVAFAGTPDDNTGVIRVASDGKPAKAKTKRAKPRRFTWRVALFALLFLVIIGAAIGAIGYQARHSYYVAFNGNNVTIFRGKQGGVLWFKPTVEQTTDITRDRVPPAEVDRVTKGHEVSSVAEGEQYVDNLRREELTVGPAATTTTTTTTTTTALPTTAPPPGTSSP